MPLKANRNIIAALLTYSAQSGTVIDIEKALIYPLSPIALNISNGNETRCVISKSKLLQCIKPVHNETALPQKNSVTDYIINLVTIIHTLKYIPTIFEELSWKFLKTLPSGYRSMHIVADTYQETSIKNFEREKRDSLSNIFIKSVSTMIPQNLPEFLQSGCNKTSLIELLFEYFHLNFKIR